MYIIFFECPQFIPSLYPITIMSLQLNLFFKSLDSFSRKRKYEKIRAKNVWIIHHIDSNPHHTPARMFLHPHVCNIHYMFICPCVYLSFISFKLNKKILKWWSDWCGVNWIWGSFSQKEYVMNRIMA